MQAPQRFVQPPETARIEAADDQIAFRPQHPCRLAQYLVRIFGEFENMRQQHQIQAVAVERQLRANQAHGVPRVISGAEAQRHPVAAQKIMLRQPQLQRVVAEYIAHRPVEIGLLARQHIAALRSGKPFAQTFRSYFTIRHRLLPARSMFASPIFEITAIPALQDNYIWAIHDDQHAAVVDPGEAAPVLAFLHARGLKLDAILCTHRHHDHSGGIPTIRTSLTICAKATDSSWPRPALCSTSSRFPATSMITSRSSHRIFCSAATCCSAQAAAGTLKGHLRSCTIPCNALPCFPTPPEYIAPTNTPLPTCASRWPASRITPPLNNASPPPNNCVQQTRSRCPPPSRWKKPPTPSCAAPNRKSSVPCNSAA